MELEILDRMYLMGDEDTGVSLHCKDCDRGGLPIAFYDQWGSPYGNDVVPVTTIGGLVTASVEHVRNVHGEANAHAD